MRLAVILFLAAILAVSAVVEARLTRCTKNNECPPRYQCVNRWCSDKCRLMRECLPGLACVLGRCKDICEGACGMGAKCDVILNEAVCTCPEGQEGDPQELCVAHVGKEA